MNGLRNVLKENGVQVTRQRLVIYEILRELNTHVTAEDILRELQNRNIAMTVATVYNILNLFEKKGLVMRVGTSGEPVIFDVNTYAHAHICDAQTRQVRDYPDSGLLEAVSRYLKEHPVKDLDVTRVEISIIGHNNPQQS